jgi:uncharacterized membrane protein YhhN
MTLERDSLTKIQKIALLFFVIPFLSSLIALETGIFFFKSAVAGSCMLILLLFYAQDFSRYKDVFFVITAFAFSIGGDWFLSHKGDNFLMFAAGIGLFFFAHVGYLGYALKNGSIQRLFTILLFACFLLFFALLLYPAIESKLILVAVFVYLLISCISLGAAAGMFLPPMSKWLYFFGITLILFSDTLIAFNEFLDYDKFNTLILPTYYIAQISVTLAVILKTVFTKPSAN